MKNQIARIAYKSFNIAVALSVAGLVLLELPALAVIVVVAGKWRTFAVRPYYWLKNIRANSCDFIVGISLVVLMSYAVSLNVYIYAMTLFYIVWLLWIKPSKASGIVGVQAVTAQVLGSAALWTLLLLEWNFYGLFLLVFLVASSSMRHMLGATSIKDLQPAIRRTLVFGYAVIQLFLAFFSWMWFVVYTYNGITISQYALLSLLVSISWFIIVYHAVANIEVKKSNVRQQMVFLYVTVLFIVLFSYTQLT